MLIHKCDKCGKKIADRNERITVDIGMLGSRVLLCKICGKSTKDFLKKNSLINKEEINQFKISLNYIERKVGAN